MRDSGKLIIDIMGKKPGLMYEGEPIQYDGSGIIIGEWRYECVIISNRVWIDIDVLASSINDLTDMLTADLAERMRKKHLFYGHRVLPIGECYRFVDDSDTFEEDRPEIQGIIFVRETEEQRKLRKRTNPHTG